MVTDFKQSHMVYVCVCSCVVCSWVFVQLFMNCVSDVSSSSATMLKWRKSTCMTARLTSRGHDLHRETRFGLFYRSCLVCLWTHTTVNVKFAQNSVFHKYVITYSNYFFKNRVLPMQLWAVTCIMILHNHFCKCMVKLLKFLVISVAIWSAHVCRLQFDVN